MQDSLYRFRPLNTHTIDELKKSYLYFSTIDGLNDPMECFYRLSFCEKANENTDLYKNLFKHFLATMRLVSIDFTLDNKELFKKDLAKKAFKIRNGIKIFDDIEAWVNENCKSIADSLINRQVWENEIKKHLIEIYKRFYWQNNKELKFAESRVVEYLAQIRKFTISELIVCCFYKSKDSLNYGRKILKENEILMWAHYASGHSGICVEFGNIVESNTNFGDKIEPKKINYKMSENYNTKNLQFSVGLALSNSDDFKLKFLPERIAIKDIKNLYDAKYQYIFNTKLDAWEKEYEHRISIAKKDLTNKKLAYKAECLKSITFGAKTPQCKQREMIRIVRNKNPNIRFYKVEIDENRGVLVRKPLQNSNEREV